MARRFSIGSGQCHGTTQQGSMSVGRGLGSAALGGSAEVGWCEVEVGPRMCWSTYVVWCSARPEVEEGVMAGIAGPMMTAGSHG